MTDYAQTAARALAWAEQVSKEPDLDRRPIEDDPEAIGRLTKKMLAGIAAVHNRDQ